MAVQGVIVKLAVAVEGSILVLAWVLGWLVGAPPFERVHLQWQAVTMGTVATLPPLLVMWLYSRSRWGPFRGLMYEIEHKIIPLFTGCSQFDLILICVLAGVGEEAMFRGVMQSLLTELVSPGLALVLTSILFGFGHFITPMYAVLAGVLGFYLGWLSLAQGNLLAAMITHALYDYVALRFLLYRYKS